MIQRLLLTTIIISLLLVGCQKVAPTNTEQQNEPSPTVTATTNNEDVESPVTNTPTTTITTSDVIDYYQYIKSWVEKKDNFSLYISKIEDEKIMGRLDTYVPAVLSHYDLINFTGTIINDTAECQFSDRNGNKGNIKLIFKPNDEMEATITLVEKSENIKERPQEGTFQFRPYNLKDIEEFSIFEDQSFTVDLNSWGNVNFVSGKLIGGNHIPTVFYLTNEDGDLLYDFDSTLPYNVDVKAVSIKDVNKDELKDIIIIGVNNYTGSEITIATVYIQNADGLFNCDYDLDFEINKAGNNTDIQTVLDYLSKKF